ncbi:RE1 [Symbiodinium sp. CCMP2592]|nr:RE1 [Symbiodinium sp. CCMP2592]
MYKMTKPQLVAELLKYNEHPAPAWTKVEIRQRLLELQGKETEPSQRELNSTGLQKATREMRKASKTKAQLQAFCENELDMTLTGNETKPQLEMKALNKIMMVTQAESMDVAGFGKHVDRRYHEFLGELRSYGEWVVQTAKENPETSDPRLRRLAGWLEPRMAMEALGGPVPGGYRSSMASASSWNANPTAAPKALLRPKKPAVSESMASSPEVIDDQAKKMAEMEAMIHKLQDELSNLKAEPPRKQTAYPDEDSMTDRSFTKAEDTEGREVQGHGLSVEELQLGLQKDKEAAVSCGQWNSCDLSDKEGAGTLECFGNPTAVSAEADIVDEKLRMYILGYLQHWSPQHVTCTSFVINDNCRHKALETRALDEGKDWTGNRVTIRHWTHPVTGEQQNFMVIVDEGWIQHFGKPKTIRLDPAGSFRAGSVEGFCDRHGIYLDIIPGEAHWQIGVAEQAIQGIKQLMSKMVQSEREASAEELLSLAVSVFNQREMVRGFSPTQHVLGVSPDTTGHFVQLPGPEHGPILNNSEAEFRREANLRAEAEKALAEWNAQQRIQRAINSRSRPDIVYQPGDLVYFWRTQESNKSKKQPGTNQGRFLGPARVLAMETRKDADGQRRPAHSIWCVRGRSLIKCSPEQLRPASHREELVEGLSEQDSTPWTFNRLADEVGGNQYQDISGEVPSAAEWARAQDVQQEAPPTRHRITTKRPLADLNTGDQEMPDELETGTSQPSVIRRLAPGEPHPGLFSSAGHWRDDVRPSAWVAEHASFWTDEDAAVEVAVEVPESRRGLEGMSRDMQSFFVGALKRKAVEVSERRLSPEDRARFQDAKGVEVKNFIAAKAFEALPSHLKPHQDQVIGMRWILTWKVKDDGSVKPKARAVLLGYQDPGYEHRATTAPVMTRQTRQLLLQLAANKRWRLMKGDVSGAFLQGREYPTELFCAPCDEICTAMGLAPGSVTRLRRACYGLVDAPLEWYKTVAEFLSSLGLERLWSDSCAWVWRKEGEVRGMISGHVDDFLFGGRDDDMEWQGILKQIQERFKWGDWDKDKFVQCGVLIEANEHGFQLSQPNYTEGIEAINLSSSRRKMRKAPTTDYEKTKLRALLGGLSWHAQQVAPHASADVGLMLSEVNHSTVDTLIKANQLLENVKARKDHKMLITRQVGEMHFYAWVDAANQNRVDGGSTQGILIGASSEGLLKGEVEAVSPISWHSTRIDRACRSPGASETAAAVNGEDLLYYVRYQWSEMLYGRPNLRQPDETVSRVPGCVITDSRNVYDKLATAMYTVNGAEKRANIELMGLKESQDATGVVLRWVHSEAQLANALTKIQNHKELELFYSMRHRWRIVEDPEMKSARKRKDEGLEPLQQGPDVEK